MDTSTLESSLWELDEEESKALQSLSIQETNILQLRENLNVDDVFIHSDPSELISDRNIVLDHLETTFTSTGYREGLDDTEDKLLQYGFDVGFVNGSSNGVLGGIERGTATALNIYQLLNTPLTEKTITWKENCALMLSMAMYSAAAKKLDEPEKSRFTPVPIADKATFDSHIDTLNSLKCSRPGIPLACASSTGSPHQSKAQDLSVDAILEIKQHCFTKYLPVDSSLDVEPLEGSITSENSIEKIRKMVVESNVNAIVPENLRHETFSIGSLYFNAQNPGDIHTKFCPQSRITGRVEEILNIMHQAQKQYEREILETGICSCNHDHDHDHGHGHGHNHGHSNNNHPTTSTTSLEHAVPIAPSFEPETDFM